MIHDHAYDDDDAPDRDTWCTPKWLADAAGYFDVDACTNARSHIRARILCDLDGNPSRDGLAFAKFCGRGTRVWCNPPYSRGSVLRFVDAYRHTRFTFLVRFDPSTEWFARLWSASSLVCVSPFRINFEAPPGVELRHKMSNPFPHALFLRDANDATADILRHFYVLDPRKDRP